MSNGTPRTLFANAGIPDASRRTVTSSSGGSGIPASSTQQLQRISVQLLSPLLRTR
jgi:hypothetical protein